LSSVQLIYTIIFTYLGGGCGKSSVVGKVVELSRKNRSLSAELASEQNKVKQLEDKLKDLTSEQFQPSNAQLVLATDSLPSSSDNQDAKVNAYNLYHFVVMHAAIIDNYSTWRTAEGGYS